MRNGNLSPSPNGEAIQDSTSEYKISTRGKTKKHLFARIVLGLPIVRTIFYQQRDLSIRQRNRERQNATALSSKRALKQAIIKEQQSREERKAAKKSRRI